MQRPFFSQSPKRVGSGPLGPPISRGGEAGTGGCGGVTGGSTAADDACCPTPWGSFCIGARVCQNRAWQTTVPRTEPGALETMEPSHISPATPVALTGLGVLAVRGPEARKFLNGQLSQDVTTLDPRQVRRAGLHNPQGRVIALLQLVARDDDPTGTEVLCVLPRSLLAETEGLLRRYLLRAKATLQDVSADWRVEGLWNGMPGSIDSLGAAEQQDGVITWRHAPDGRWLRLSPLPRASTEPPEADPTIDASADPSGTAPAAQSAWHLADLSSGLPQIHPATRGAFVAQMLNLDVLGGISFTKGCYTGQEVIARAHYRGRVKRRLQRFEAPPPSPGAALPDPGAALKLADGRAAQWVDGALRPDGRWEFLAVAPLATGQAAEAVAMPDPAADLAAGAPTDAKTVLRLETTALPLPYPLTD